MSDLTERNCSMTPTELAAWLRQAGEDLARNEAQEACFRAAADRVERIKALEAELDRVRADADYWKARHESLLSAVEKDHGRQALSPGEE